MSTLKFRFIKMMKKWAPIKKSELTRRALGQLRIDMPTLDDLIAECVDDELINQRKFNSFDSKGFAPQVYFLTAGGKDWLKVKLREQKQQLKRLK